MFSFLEKLFFKINDNSVAATVFCELSKALDCVNRKIMISKLLIYPNLRPERNS